MASNPRSRVSLSKLAGPRHLQASGWSSVSVSKEQVHGAQERFDQQVHVVSKQVQGPRRQHATSSPLTSSRDSAGLLHRPASGTSESDRQISRAGKRRIDGVSGKSLALDLRRQQAIGSSVASVSKRKIARHQRDFARPTMSVSQQGGPRCQQAFGKVS